MSNRHPTMTFVGCEVDPAGVYTVQQYGEMWVVRRCDVIVGALPPKIVSKSGPLPAAEWLIGYGVFVSRRVYSLGFKAWMDDGFPAIVDKEVASL